MEAPITPLDGAILKLPGMLDRLLHHGCALSKGVADEIPLIKHDLEKMVAISSNLVDDRAMMVRCWRKEVRELSYDMEDFVDQYEHAASVSYTGSVRGHKITQQRKGKKTLPYWIREKLRQRLWMSNKIREFSTRAQEILRRHELYNLDAIAGSSSTRCTDAYSSAYSTSWSSTLYGEENAYVGIDAALKNLEELLMATHDQGHQKLRVVSLVGFGGIGKTTLAMELYRKLGHKFECRAFVRTSQKPDMRRILISMLSQIRPHQPPDNWAVHSLISTIKTHLQDKRYLIIVEDLCSTSTWDIVKCALPGSNCCSRILTTTEIEDLALQSCDHDRKHVYKIQPLGEDNSRKLFFSSVFGSQEECPPELREISHDIIRKCGGLPMAILTVASILSSQPGIQDRWDYVNKAIGYSLLTNPTWEGMKQVLGLSYNNLPQHLKACILYTGLYEEDTIIWKDDLVNQWIAEGFIQATEGQDKKEVARSFFDRLISGKLILPVDINKNGEVLSCTVHHMVLNLVIRSKSIEENFVTAIHHSQASTTLADKVRRLSLQFGNAEDAMPPTNMRLSHVRTLAFWGVFKCLPSVVQFRLLQVLILHFWGDKDSITFDITRISDFFRLRYLKVTSNVALELRTQMRGLQSLETLTIDARVCAVPSDIVRLQGLLHLSLPDETNLPNGIGHMTSLRTLGYFDLSSNSIQNVESLSMLTNLGDLQLTCSTVQPEILNKKLRLLLNSILGKLSNLKSLTLVPRASSYAKSMDDAGATCIPISGGSSSLSSAPALLQSIEVSSRICIFSCTPMWIGQLRKLCILKFGVRKVDQGDVDILRGLPVLAVLSVYVHSGPAPRIVIGKTGFPVLKYFKFKCCDPRLKFEEGAMPNLCRLKLAFNACNAHQQSTIPVGMEYLSELKEVSAKIGGVDPEESHGRVADAELAFRDAIRVHASCQRVNVQCVKQTIIGDTGDDLRILPEYFYSIRLRFLNVLKPTIFTDEKLTSENGEAIRLAMFQGYKVVKSGPLSSVKVEILVLRGDFNNCRDDSWTEDDFDNHIVRGQDGQDLVLGTAWLTNGEVELSHIRFKEGPRREKVIMAARVCKSEKTSARVQEAIMVPAVRVLDRTAVRVLDRRNIANEKSHPPRLNDAIYRLEGIARDGVDCMRLHEAKIYTVQGFLKALNEDPDKLRAILNMEIKENSWSKLTKHARECVLIDKPEVKRYRSEDGNVVLFFNCVHDLIGAAFPYEYVACEKFDPAQKALADKWKRHAYGKLRGIFADYIMKKNIPEPISSPIFSDNQLVPYQQEGHSGITLRILTALTFLTTINPLMLKLLFKHPIKELEQLNLIEHVNGPIYTTSLSTLVGLVN